MKINHFEFRETPHGAKVYFKHKHLGEIVTWREANGRHCFRLGCDVRKTPRTYRGRLNAALALLSIHEMAAKARRHNWPAEKLILEAWDARPLVVG